MMGYFVHRQRSWASTGMGMFVPWSFRLSTMCGFRTYPQKISPRIDLDALTDWLTLGLREYSPWPVIIPGDTDCGCGWGLYDTLPLQQM